jgi:biotin operon repressor
MAKKLLSTKEICEKLELSQNQVRYALLKLRIEGEEMLSGSKSGPRMIRGYDLLDVAKIREYHRSLVS